MEMEMESVIKKSVSLKVPENNMFLGIPKAKSIKCDGNEDHDKQSQILVSRHSSLSHMYLGQKTVQKKAKAIKQNYIILLIVIFITMLQIFKYFEILNLIECELIIWVQQKLNISQNNVMLQRMTQFCDFEYQNSLFTCILITIYQNDYFDIMQKVYMQQQMLIMVFIINQQLFQQLPPYLQNNKIESQYCTNCYNRPSTILIFPSTIIYYIEYSYKHNSELILKLSNTNPPKSKYLKSIQISLIVYQVLLLIIEYVNGDIYLLDLVITFQLLYIVYQQRDVIDRLFSQYIRIPVKQEIHNRINLINLVQIFGCLFMFSSISYLVDFKLQGTMQAYQYNYYYCLQKNKQSVQITNYEYQIGDWPTFLQTSLVVGSSFAFIISIFIKSKLNLIQQRVNLSYHSKIISSAVSILFYCLFKFMIIDASYQHQNEYFRIFPNSYFYFFFNHLLITMIIFGLVQAFVIELNRPKRQSINI